QHHRRHHAAAGNRLPVVARRHPDPHVPSGGGPARRAPGARPDAPGLRPHAPDPRRRRGARTRRAKPCPRALPGDTVELSVVCPAEAATVAVAGRLAAEVRPGDVIVLKGALGSGKTRFAGGLAAGLGVEETVVSPSFVLMREYR